MGGLERVVKDMNSADNNSSSAAEDTTEALLSPDDQEKEEEEKGKEAGGSRGAVAEEEKEKEVKTSHPFAIFDQPKRQVLREPSNPKLVVNKRSGLSGNGNNSPSFEDDQTSRPIELNHEPELIENAEFKGTPPTTPKLAAAEAPKSKPPGKGKIHRADFLKARNSPRNSPAVRPAAVLTATPVSSKAWTPASASSGGGKKKAKASDLRALLDKGRAPQSSKTTTRISATSLRSKLLSQGNSSLSSKMV